MFESIYSDHLSQYYSLRSDTLSDSARKHELCYLRRFDAYVAKHLKTYEGITEAFVSEWVGSLSGKSGSVENEVVVIRQFLTYLGLSGECVFLPVVPKVRDDYVPYIFSDKELSVIFDSADNIVLKDPKADPYITIEFPVIIRLLYSCGLRVGETVKISMPDVDLDNGILRMLNTKRDKHRLVPMVKAPDGFSLPQGTTSIYRPKRSSADLVRYLWLMASVWKTVKSMREGHVCTVFDTFSRSSRSPRQNDREDIWMTPFRSCPYILVMTGSTKLPNI
jgi:hypothetical protein